MWEAGHHSRRKCSGSQSSCNAAAQDAKKKLFDVVSQIVMPALLVMPRRTQLDSMAIKKTQYRYIAELNTWLH